MYFYRNEAILPITTSSSGWEFFIQSETQFPQKPLNPNEVLELVNVSNRKLSVPAHFFQHTDFREIQKLLKPKAQQLTLLVSLHNVSLYENEIQDLLNDGWSVRLGVHKPLQRMPESAARVLNSAPRRASLMIIANIQHSVCDILKSIDPAYWDRAVFNFTEKIKKGGQDFHINRARSIVEVERLDRMLNGAGFRNLTITNFQNLNDKELPSFATQENPLLDSSHKNSMLSKALPRSLWKLAANPTQILLETFAAILRIFLRPFSKSSYSSLRDLLLRLFNATIGALFWATYGFCTRFIGGVRKFSTDLYWIFQRRASSGYWRGFRVFSELFGLSQKVYGFLRAIMVRTYWFIYRNTRPLQTVATRLYWFLYKIYSSSVGLMRSFNTRLYWAIRRQTDRLKPIRIAIYWFFYNIFSKIAGHLNGFFGWLKGLQTRLYWAIRRQTDKLKPIRIAIYWFFYNIFSRVFGVLRKTIVHEYWRVHSGISKFTLIVKQVYWQIYAYASKGTLSLKQVYWRIYAYASKGTLSLKQVYWRIYAYASKGTLSLKQVYWQIYAYVSKGTLSLKQIYWRIYAHACTFTLFIKKIYWVVYAASTQIIGRTRAFFVVSYWKYYTRVQEFKNRPSSLGHRLFQIQNKIYWTTYSLCARVIGIARAIVVRAYWFMHGLLMSKLFWPVRKIYWFTEFQFQKRILRRDYGR